MTKNPQENTKNEKGNSKTGLGKMWAYFAVWAAFIALGIFAMANSDTSKTQDTANKKIEKKEAGKKETSLKNTSANDQRLAKK
ncbi:MAG TPA: hypothetical protein DCS93_01540 [Microscillaceae bacterium]|nr:hypothetical protein [Microscillaceae bacterium]